MREIIFILLTVAIPINSSSQTWSGWGTDSLYRLHNLPGEANTDEYYFLSTDSLLYLSGNFRYAGDILVNNITAWDGINWHQFGTGIGGGLAYSLYYMDDMLYIGGAFDNIGPFSNIGGLAQWDGNNWSGVGGDGNPNHFVGAIITIRDTLYIGGVFTKFDSTIANFREVACLHDTHWNNMNGGFFYGYRVYAMEQYSDELIVGGDFGWVGGIYAYSIARWNGIGWNTIGGGTDGFIQTMLVDSIYNFLYVGGYFDYVYNNDGESVLSRAVARWNGFYWESMGTGWINSNVLALEMYNGYLYAGGVFDTIDSKPIPYLARWNYSEWDSLGSGVNCSVLALATYKDELYVGGCFTIAGGDSAYGIARYYIPPDTSCNYLQPRAFVLDDTLTLWQGHAGAQLYNNNAYADSWYWDFGDGDTSTEKDPLHDYTDTGIYNVSVTVTHGTCVKTATNTVVVEINTGIANIKAWDYGFKVYPNPTSGEITVECNMPNNVKGEIKTFNSYGSVRGNFPLQTGQNKLQIKPDEIPTGISLCGLYIEGKQVLIEKVVKCLNH